MNQAPSRFDFLRSVAMAASLAMLVVVSIAVAAIIFIAGKDDQAKFVERRYAEIAKTFKAAIDPRFQTKAVEISRVVSRLVVIEAIKGAALLDETGHLLEIFGERPRAGFEDIRRTSAVIFEAEKSSRADFYYAPSHTETPFHLIVRTDVSEISALEGIAAGRQMTIAIGGGLAGAILTFVVVWLFVGRPARRIADTLERALAEPAKADQGNPLRRNATEIGRLAAIVERFRGVLAETWRTKVLVAEGILERAPFAIVQIAGDGSPTSANPAMAQLIGQDVVRTQENLLSVRDLEGGSRISLAAQVAAHPGAVRLVEMAGRTDTRHVLAGGFVLGTGTRTQTTIALLADITDIWTERCDALMDLGEAMNRLRFARQREAELKLSLEACLTLMSGPDRPADETLDPVPYAIEWLEMAEMVGLVKGVNIVTPEGPTVEAPPEDLRAAMRLALLVCYARCGGGPVSIVLDAKGINFETAGVSIAAKPAPTEDGLEPEPVLTNWQLAFAALRTAIRRANGQLSEFNANEEGVVVRFVLRGTAERMQAVKAR